MHRYCKEIGETIEIFKPSYEVFRENATYHNAISMCLMQIGELSAHLTDEFKELSKGIDWKGMRGMRNHFAHGYSSMDYQTIWDVVQTNIPQLQEFCEKTIDWYEKANAPSVELEEEDEIEFE